jgi:hypothetical protein
VNVALPGEGGELLGGGRREGFGEKRLFKGRLREGVFFFAISVRIVA